MKKRHPKVPEQLGGKPGFHLDKAAEGKLDCFGWERRPEIPKAVSAAAGSTHAGRMVPLPSVCSIFPCSGSCFGGTAGLGWRQVDGNVPWNCPRVGWTRFWSSLG